LISLSLIFSQSPVWSKVPHFFLLKPLPVSD
jgi:hypothetical protein